MNKLKPLESSRNSCVFFGTEHYSDVVLNILLNRGVVVSTVITKPDFKTGRGQKVTSPKVKITAQKHGIQVLQPNSNDDICDAITDSKCDFGVLAAYGKLLPKRTLDLFKGGILNIHPSLLPKWRGPSPVEAAILAGETETGVSIIKLSEKMDAGPVYLQQKVALKGSETKPQLYNELFSLGAELLAANLSRVVAGSLQPTDQDESNATYCQLLKKEDGFIDWSKPANEYERQIRAYLGYPRSSAEIKGQHVVITKARVAKNAIDRKLVMPCSEGYLEILELVAPSGKTISGEEFLRGYGG